MLVDTIKNLIRGISITKPIMQSASYAPLSSLFGGEKDFFNMGFPKRYNVDYYTMADRAYDLYITNEFVRAAINRLVEFAVGKGLELLPEPDIDFLERKHNIKLKSDFSRDIQSLWELFKTETSVSSDKQSTIDGLAIIVMLNSLLAGDILIIKRIVNGELEYQLVDGRNVRYSSNVGTFNGNKVINGVEIDDKGKPVAYHIYNDEKRSSDRIEAYNKYGDLVAWLTFADHNRVGSTRGYSILGAIMQKLDNIGKYTENEVIASKTNAQFAATIEQDNASSGVNPMKGLFSPANLINDVPSVDTTSSPLWEKLATQFKAMTNAVIMHMPKGQKLVSYDTKRPNVNFSGFLDANTKYIYASMGLPYEVVLMVFQNNFSASRASLKMFEMILDIMRLNIIIKGFYFPVYKQWFELEVLKGNIDAPRYLELKNKPGYLDNAYIKSKFIGAPIPHIDPVKEVNAIVTKLKNGLTTFEGALQELGNRTNFQTLVKKVAEEHKKWTEVGVDISLYSNKK